MPPLRERSEDLPIMLARLLQEAAAAMGKKVPTAPARRICRHNPSLITINAIGHVPDIASLASFP
jgi:hypothetical protein